MRKLASLTLLPLLLAALVAGVAAQPPTPTPVRGFVPQGTPDAGVRVIPPTPGDPVEDILNNPAVLIPRPTLDQRTGEVPPNFLSVGSTAIVVNGPLRVRAAPNTNPTTAILVQLQRGHDVTVLALNNDLRWAFVDTRGPDFLQGWVSTQFIELFEGDIDPFAPSLPGAATTGFTLRAQQTVNIRSAPVLFSDRVGILPAGTQATIVGVTSTYSWWKIEVDDTVGWVSGTYIYVENPAAYREAPLLTR